MEAAKNVRNANMTCAWLQAKPNTLYLRWTYHPYGLQQKDIRRIFDKTLKPALDCYDKMQIAVSRPKNLRDILTRAALQIPNNDSINDQSERHKANMISQD
jgi:hypothetical protein